MRMTRFAQVALILVAVLALLGTMLRLPLAGRGNASSIIARPASSPVYFASALSPNTKLLMSRALVKYSAAKPLRVSDHFHRWRFDSLKSDYPSNAEIQSGLGRVQDRSRFQQTFTGSAPLLFRSPFGWEVRQRTPEAARQHWEYEHHVDQFLATCAEIGVPASCQFATDFGKVSIGELLDASRRSFEPSQELCWTLVAYCTYLPDESQWTNRFGESCSYESIVTKILEAPLNEGSCGGTHKQFALAYFLSKGRVNGDLRRRCEGYLQRSSDALRVSQLSSGAWTPGWAKADVGSTIGAASIRGVDLVQITGHHLEWICLAPPSVRPSTECVSRASHFLAEALDRADITSIQKDYCAYSHAASMLQRSLLQSQTPPERIIERSSKAATKSVNRASVGEGSLAVVQTP